MNKLNRDLAVIFDLDGVLCEEFPVQKSGETDWWKQLERLYPLAFSIEQNVYLVRMCAGRGVRVFIFTSRQESSRAITERWLREHNIVYAEVFMRPAGCADTPAAVKERMLNRLLERGECGDILFAVDDNQDVCAMYASRGINTLKKELGA